MRFAASGLRSVQAALVVVVVGAAAQPLNRAYAEDTTWVQLDPPVSPPARERASMATGGDGQAVVLYGGEGNSGLLDDTWILEGKVWSQRRPATRPPTRAGRAV